MKKIFLLLVVMMLSNFKSFSQNDMIIADDSLVCFPMRYLTFIKADLLKGDETEKKSQSRDIREKIIKINLQRMGKSMTKEKEIRDREKKEKARRKREKKGREKRAVMRPSG